ncbi:MAG TPA: hypothetical protein VLF20_01000 [Patescibacteria group bacterium]|nr:hypothetical protein [Patescibacteria group bacterium]
MKRSRLRSHLQEQSMHSMLLAIGGIIAIIILLFLFGPQLLINFSLLVKKSSDANETTKKEVLYIAPPILNPMNEATNSAEIIISGYAQDKQEIRLYINGKQHKKTTVSKDNNFSFSDVKLEKGDNEIKAKVITDDKKESGYSEITTITYIADPPTLDISFPSDGQTISKDNRNITVRGKTNENVKVTINDFWAITKDDGSFSYTLSLADGENTIRIKAKDAAGNETIREIKVKVE